MNNIKAPLINNFKIFIYVLITSHLVLSNSFACNENDISNNIVKLLEEQNKQKIQVNFNTENKIFSGDCNNFELIKNVNGEFTVKFKDRNTHHYINGKYTKLISIPVINKNVNSGHIIAESDIVFVEVPDRLISANVIVDKRLLIDLETKRNISAHKPVTAYDIGLPILIKRSDVINLVYTANHILLKMKAIALESGTRNEVIKFRNIRSKKEVFATVASKDEAHITS